MLKKYEVFESNSIMSLVKLSDTFRAKSWYSSSLFKIKHFVLKTEDKFSLQQRVISNVLVSKRHVLIENNSQALENIKLLDKRFFHIGFIFLEDPPKKLEEFSVRLEKEIKILKEKEIVSN